MAKQKTPDFYTIPMDHKWNVESMDATLMEGVDDFDVAQLIAQLACMGYLYANGAGEICLQESGDVEALKDSIDAEFEEIADDDGPNYNVDEDEEEELSDNLSFAPTKVKA